MANPKGRHSRSRRDKRRSHDALTQSAVSLCPRCHQPKLPHHVCLSCGYYKGRLIIPEEEIKA